MTVDISGWRGAAPDASCFYSTSSSIAQKDWLPTLRTKFALHLTSSKSKNGAPSNHPAKLPNLTKYKESGFTKNTIGFVSYDKTVDEKEIKYSEEAFLTLHADLFRSPKKQSAESFDRQSIVSQEILDSGFTKIPRKFPPKKELPVISEMLDHYQNHQSKLKNGHFDKANIAASQSAFANDITHIKSFGASKGSPFERFELYPEYAFHDGPAHDYPVLMKADGYTRSSGKTIALKNRPSTPPKSNFAYPLADAIIIGHKQEAGSIKNNQAYREIKELDPFSRFSSETAKKYGKASEKKPENMNCNAVSRTGFTLCNKFSITANAELETSIVNRLHPLVAGYRAEKLKHVYGIKPTGRVVS